MATTVVWVRFTYERQHRWPDAPLDAIHDHLRSLHRHLFHIEVGVEVTDENRAVSFERLRADSRLRFADRVPVASDWSCETMAAALAAALTAGTDGGYSRSYPTLRYVTVSEDGESGATWRTP